MVAAVVVVVVVVVVVPEVVVVLLLLLLQWDHHQTWAAADESSRNSDSERDYRVEEVLALSSMVPKRMNSDAQYHVLVYAREEEEDHLHPFLDVDPNCRVVEVVEHLDQDLRDSRQGAAEEELAVVDFAVVVVAAAAAAAAAVPVDWVEESLPS
jgi:hypothetical protein